MSMRRQLYCCALQVLCQGDESWRGWQTMPEGYRQSPHFPQMQALLSKMWTADGTQQPTAEALLKCAELAVPCDDGYINGTTFMTFEQLPCDLPQHG